MEVELAGEVLGSIIIQSSALSVPTEIQLVTVAMDQESMIPEMTMV